MHVFCGAFSKGPRGKCTFSAERKRPRGKCTFSAELSVSDRGESARFLLSFQ